MSQVGCYTFDAIDNAPSGAGLYAWYYVPTIGRADLEAAVQILQGTQGSERINVARELLVRLVFSELGESPYSVRLEGKLKPLYAGAIGYQHSFGEADRLISEEPDRLVHVVELLRRVVPHFAAPIYIGMTEEMGLRRRLRSHAAKIEELVEAVARAGGAVDVAEASDNEFASEVVRRRMNPANLVVHTMTIDVQRKGVAKTAEAILNRVHYPLCGRR